MGVGERIRKYRKDRGFTQTQLAQKAGISRSYLADVEAGRYNPSLSTLFDIAAPLGVPASILLDDKEIDFSNLMSLCQRSDMTLNALAKIIEISGDDLNLIRSNRLPDDDTMNKICDYFNCTWDYLIGKTNVLNEIIIGEESILLPDTNAPLNLTEKVPILGTVAAGFPLYAEQNVIGHEEVPKSFLKGAEHFFLIVKGESMTGSRIYPGDKVLIRRQPEVENGQIALVLVGNEEATLKRVKYVNGNAILYPDNPAHEPQIYPASEVRIIGYVTQVMFDPNLKKGHV